MTAVTYQSIDARVDTVTYHRLPNSTVTVCAIRMVNGFTVLGESACVDPRRFDRTKGEELAYENAFDKLWTLEGYLLAERNYQSSIREETSGEGINIY